MGLAALALALRWPNYQTVPGFSDEAREILLGLAIAQGKALPLTNAATYMGALWNYLLAIAFWLIGFDLQAPRTLILLIGVITVLATYPLGRFWSGGRQLGGVLAALFLTTSTAHIVINSHVAWSNCTTPLFATLGIYGLARASSVRGFRVETTDFKDAVRPRTWLLLSGLCWGLAFQSHPSVLALLPGAAIFLVWRVRSLLCTRWLWLAAGLFVLVNFNLVVYNLTTGFDSVQRALDKSTSYTDSEEIAPRTYDGRLASLGLGLYQVIGGAIDLRDNELAYLLDPGLWPLNLLALVGVGWQWRRGNPLPALLLLSAILVLPVFNAKYRPLLNGRYLASVLPVLFSCIASVHVALFEALDRAAERQRSGRARYPLAGAGLALLIVFLAVHPLFYLQVFYDQAARYGRTNVRLFQVLDQIKLGSRSGEPVLIDQSLDQIRLGWGSGWVGSGLRLGLAVANVPNQTIDLREPVVLDLPGRCRDQLLILNLRDPDQAQAILSRFDLRSLDHRPASPISQSGGYRLYRLDRLLEAGPDC